MTGDSLENPILKNNVIKNEDYDENDNEDNDDDEDVTFLICGGNEEGGLKDFSKLSDKNNSAEVDNSINLSSDILKKGLVDYRPGITGTNNGNYQNINDQKMNAVEQGLHALNVSNTIYIDNEDTATEENPCKDLQMVWDNNPELRPWSRLLDVSPWFNYGFTEKTFKEYIIRQLGIRWERIKKQNIETSDDLLNKSVIAPTISNSNNVNANLNMNINNSSPGMPNSNIKIMGNLPPPPITGFPSNMMYFPPPPPPHLNPPIPGHPNIYHQQHMFNNFPHHIPHHSHLPPPISSHQIMHHPGLPPNNMNPGANIVFNTRGKKRPPE
ncbi:CCAAT-box DNA binding protein subunit B [Cryptosporidium ubiquitum]|uniref:CCAAT-box DNA binding protein subunit B n=1 Tax=Cryptosporidium ubiquitum TaxID=857276 RepID=A0A1J4MFF5_9CRYT|nr:CCAAT-box DNA binding protein subunit B [Cryptosporidium ubiquitum]OII72937.1 CCAAT-box DNA binding protein subunit B [Cryptosporidium ubiquitum]